MTDLVKVLREYKELMSSLSPEVIAWLEELATKPGAKLTIPTPGTEPKLNGLLAADISAMAANIPEGQSPTMSEIVRNVGGNPKSSADRTKVKNLLPFVPEIKVIPGRRTQIIRTIAPPPPSDNNPTQC